MTEILLNYFYLEGFTFLKLGSNFWQVLWKYLMLWMKIIKIVSIFELKYVSYMILNIATMKINLFWINDYSLTILWNPLMGIYFGPR